MELRRLRVMRDDAAISLSSLFCGRQDTDVALRSVDFAIDEHTMTIWLTEKGKHGYALRCVIRLPLTQGEVSGHASRATLPYYRVWRRSAAVTYMGTIALGQLGGGRWRCG